MPIWESWSGEFRQPVNEILEPSNLTELIEAVQRLEPKNGDRVHAEGSRWAFSSPAYCENFIISTNKLNGFPEALQNATTPHPSGDKFRIAVEAGIKVAVLYNVLAGRPAPPHLPPPTTPFPLLPLDKWVPATLGGAGGQSIAGAISTGTHGGDVNRPPLSDAVVAILMVGSYGELRLIQRAVKKGEPPIVKVSALQTALGMPVTDFQDDDLLNAAVVSVGRFGVIYAYVLEAVNESEVRIKETRTQSTWRAVRRGLLSDIRSVAAADGFLQVALYPARLPDGDRTCFVTKHDFIAVPSSSPLPPNVLAERASDGSRPFMQLLCQDHLTPELADLQLQLALLIPALIVSGPIALAALPPPLNLLSLVAPVAIPVLITVLGIVVDKLGRIGPDYLLGDIVSDIINLATDSGIPEVGDLIARTIVEGEQRPWVVSGTRFEIADFFDYDHDCYRGDSVEIFFEVNEHLLDKIERVFGVFDGVRARGLPYGGYVSLRFFARSNALLGLSRWTTTCSIEVSVLRGMRGNLKIMQDIQDVAVHNDGVVHWGQQNDLDQPTVANIFGPSLTAWQRQLHRVERDSLLFRNPFTFSHGLEIPLEVLRGGDPWTRDWEPLGMVTPDRRDAAAVADAGAGQPLQVFARDTGSMIVGRTRRIDGVPDSGWRPILSDTVVGQPVVKRGVSGRLELFVLDRNLQRVKHTWEIDRPGGAFAPWDTLGFGASLSLASDTSVTSPVPSVMAHIDGRLELVAQGALFEGRRRMVDVWAHFVDSAWSDAVPRGSRSIFSPPSMCLRNLRTSTINSDQMGAVALGDNGEVLVIQQRGPDGRSDWTEWVEVNPVSGPRLVAAGQPIIVAEPGTGAKVHILAMNARGELFATSDLEAGLLLTWMPWEQLDSPSAFDYLDANCRLASVVTDRVYVFARSQRGEILEIEFVPGRGWGHWINLGGETESDLSAGFHADGRIEVVARAQRDSQLHARRQISPGVWF